MAAATRRAYTTAWNRFLKWRRGASGPPLPVSQETLCGFVSHLGWEGLTPATIRLYLAGVRHQQIMAGLPDPKWGEMPKLGLILKGIRRVRAEAGPSQPSRRPVSPNLLSRLRAEWMKSPGYDGTMLWAAACLCYFGCFRAGELTAPAGGGFDTMAHLSQRDITMDKAKPPQWLSVRVKQSKTDQFRQGEPVTVGRTGQELCPVEAVRAFLAIRGGREGPLFQYWDGRPLTRARLDADLKKALERAGVDATGISTHSFRIGAATTAAQRGVQDSAIKDLGRWKSGAYLRYIRKKAPDRAKISSVLAKLESE